MATTTGGSKIPEAPKPVRSGAELQGDARKSRRPRLGRYLLALGLLLGLGAWMLYGQTGPRRSPERANPADETAQSRKAVQVSEGAASPRSPVLTGKVGDKLHPTPSERNAVREDRIRQAASSANDVEYKEDEPVTIEDISIPSADGVWKMKGLPAYTRKHRPGAERFNPRTPGHAASAPEETGIQSKPTTGVTDFPNGSEAPRGDKPTTASAAPDEGGDAKKWSDPCEDPPDGRTACKGVLSFNELLTLLQDSIPISISMLVYSGQPGERRASINGSLMHEGEQTPSGLSVKQITPEGIVFDYQGRSFYKAAR